MSKTYNIGVEATIDVIGGKWKPVMLCHLQNNGRMRTSALKRAIPTITQKMLTQQLRELEKDGIINRIVYDQVPPKVEYELSEYGQTLGKILSSLCYWGEFHVEKMYKQGESVTLNQQDFVDIPRPS
ncbi:MarR family transcriptional regulator [Staphylococcus saprophyticus]|jgi:DNA-binding HxlR family transcriptional regulator|uniref:Putative transcriptional regulator n=1 Tax=Staphylococcus saprophyticus TaxID=29385 RepID=A0A380HGZ6_STASA|nr:MULTISPECIES: helix-turn-helix domain-containing protein [Staphylococcus]AMG19101.1 transcriptional regulator [Staphylococcus saprophyticus]AMG34474.1 transcriptional regulator [Staphylococcus saprophyticus]EHY91428.1 putative transcriptional regulator [Staphylococcus saprophyticus subsp. saprophyticus KACC 16562]KIJ85933.1 MarR family transcriptional regulator [Staphylococcus saprophyticus]MBC2920404.1 helix-turn-helix transcriptional regulator [Staphylococcus saprophyticus]